jgi:hypothetical protein
MYVIRAHVICMPMSNMMHVGCVQDLGYVCCVYSYVNIKSSEIWYIYIHELFCSGVHRDSGKIRDTLCGGLISISV